MQLWALAPIGMRVTATNNVRKLAGAVSDQAAKMTNLLPLECDQSFWL